MSFQITPTGYIFIALVLLSIVLTQKIAHRANTTSLFAKMYFGLLSFAVISLFFGTVVLLSSTLHTYVVGSTYKAKVVSFTPHKEEYRKESTTRTRIMYVSYVQFVDKLGETHILPSSVRTGDKPALGSELYIVYAPSANIAEELSVKSHFLLYFNIAFLLIFGFILACMLGYAWGRPIKYQKVLMDWGSKAFKASLLLWMVIVLVSYLRAHF